MTWVKAKSKTKQLQAARALANLATDDDSRIKISAGAIPPLVALLGSPSVGIQEEAARALGNLAMNADNCIKVEDAGAIPCLVALLRSPSVGVQECAAGALRILSGLADNQAKVAAAGAIPPLLAPPPGPLGVAVGGVAGAGCRGSPQPCMRKC